jgi:hypothetical protein
LEDGTPSIEMQLTTRVKTSPGAYEPFGGRGRRLDGDHNGKIHVSADADRGGRGRADHDLENIEGSRDVVRLNCVVEDERCSVEGLTNAEGAV